MQKNLRRLNLYMTSIELLDLHSVVRSCTKLQHLNVGHCKQIVQWARILLDIAEFIPGIRSLDLWRARGSTTQAVCQVGDNLCARNLGAPPAQVSSPH